MHIDAYAIVSIDHCFIVVVVAAARVDVSEEWQIQEEQVRGCTWDKRETQGGVAEVQCLGETRGLCGCGYTGHERSSVPS